MPGEEIETMNTFGVCSVDDGIGIMFPPRVAMKKADAFLLAAYLVAMSGGIDEFLPTLKAVEGS